MRRAPSPTLSFVFAIALGGCFDDSALEGLPCSDDASCGSEYVCALGYCRAQLDDALAGCGDGIRSTGEFCFPLSRRVDLPIGDAELRAVGWADLDGDGLQDAMTVSDVATVVHINLGGAFNASVLDVELTPESLAPFGVPEPIAGLTVPARPTHLTLGDFTGDALPDAVFSLELPFEIPPEFEAVQEAVEASLWLADNQSVTMSPPMPIAGTDPLGSATIPSDGLLTGDFDGDGRDDVLITTEDQDGSTLRWLRGNDTGLGPPQLLPLQGSGPIIIADVDQDGRDDVVVLRRAAGVVSWLHGPLDSSPMQQSLDAPVAAMHLAPLDDTPGLELATVGSEPSTRQVWSWSGDGWTLAASREGPSASSLATGDLDGDGVVDLLTTGLEGIMVHSGFAGPELGAPFIIVDEVAVRLETRQLDGDAAPDLVLRDAQRLVVRFANP